MHTIENDKLKVSASEQGAELTSIKSVSKNIEYLWQADASVWPRHAPVLFPIVGKVEGGKYTFEGNTYELPQHGFARDMEFSLLSKTDNELVFQLQSNEETLKKYPFKFELHLSYKLSGNSLLTTYTVFNQDNKDMYFSIGAHPGFLCPLNTDESFEDYFLEFEKDETVNKFLLSDGLLSGEEALVLNNKNTLPVTEELFKSDALVFKNLASEKITLKSKKSSNSVSMEFKGFPFFGIWAKPGTKQFVCLEPWNGIASTKSSGSDITFKEGILKLEVGKSHSCAFNLIFN